MVKFACRYDFIQHCLLIVGSDFFVNILFCINYCPCIDEANASEITTAARQALAPGTSAQALERQG
jgi:hypothetical protein